MTIEHFGDNVRIEQRSAPVRPVPRTDKFSNKMLNKAGRVITSNVINRDEKGNPIWAWVVYQKEIVKDGMHPWIGEKTSKEFIWMPVAEYPTYQEAVMAAKKLAG